MSKWLEYIFYEELKHHLYSSPLNNTGVRDSDPDTAENRNITFDSPKLNH